MLGDLLIGLNQPPQGGNHSPPPAASPPHLAISDSSAISHSKQEDHGGYERRAAIDAYYTKRDQLQGVLKETVRIKDEQLVRAMQAHSRHADIIKNRLERASLREERMKGDNAALEEDVKEFRDTLAALNKAMLHAASPSSSSGSPQKGLAGTSNHNANNVHYELLQRAQVGRERLQESSEVHRYIQKSERLLANMEAITQNNNSNRPQKHGVNNDSSDSPKTSSIAGTDTAATIWQYQHEIEALKCQEGIFKEELASMRHALNMIIEHTEHDLRAKGQAAVEAIVKEAKADLEHIPELKQDTFLKGLAHERKRQLEEMGQAEKRIEELTTEKKFLEKSLKTAEQEVIHMRLKMMERDSSMAIVNKSTKQLELKIFEEQKFANTRIKKAEKVASDIAQQYEEEINRLNSQIQNLQQELVSSRDENRDLLAAQEAEKISWNTTMENKEKMFSGELAHQKATSGKELDKASDSLSRLNDEHRKLKEEFRILSAKFSDINVELDQSRDELLALQSNLQKTVDEREHYVDEAARLTQTLEARKLAEMQRMTRLEKKFNAEKQRYLMGSSTRSGGASMIGLDDSSTASPRPTAHSPTKTVHLAASTAGANKNDSSAGSPEFHSLGVPQQQVQRTISIATNGSNQSKGVTSNPWDSDGGSSDDSSDKMEDGERAGLLAAELEILLVAGSDIPFESKNKLYDLAAQLNRDGYVTGTNYNKPPSPKMQELQPSSTNTINIDNSDSKPVFSLRDPSSFQRGQRHGDRAELSENGAVDAPTNASESQTTTTTSKPNSQITGTKKLKNNTTRKQHGKAEGGRNDTSLRINIHGVDEADDMFANLRIQSRDASVDTTDFVAHHLSHTISAQATPQIIHEDSRTIFLLAERQRHDPSFPQDVNDVNLLNRSDKLSILQKVSPYVQARSCQTTLSGEVQPTNVTKHVMAQQQLKGQFSKGGDSIFKKAAKDASSSSPFRSVGGKTPKTLAGSTTIQQHEREGDSKSGMSTVPPGAAEHSSSSRSIVSDRNIEEVGVPRPPTLLGGANNPQHSLPEVSNNETDAVNSTRSASYQSAAVAPKRTGVQVPPSRVITTDTASSAVVQVVHRGCMTAAIETPISSSPGLNDGASSPTLTTHHTTPELPSHDSIDDLFETLESSDFEHEQETLVETLCDNPSSALAVVSPIATAQPVDYVYPVSKSTIHQSVQTVHSMPVSGAPKQPTIRLSEIQSFLDKVSTPRHPSSATDGTQVAAHCEEHTTTAISSTQEVNSHSASSAPSIDPSRLYFAAEEASRSVVRAAWEARWWAIAQDFHKTTSEYQSDLAAREVAVSLIAAERAAESDPTMHHVFELIVTPPATNSNAEDIPAFQFVGAGNHTEPIPSTMMEVSGMFTPISIASDLFAQSSSVKIESKTICKPEDDDISLPTTVTKHQQTPSSPVTTKNSRKSTPTLHHQLATNDDLWGSTSSPSTPSTKSPLLSKTSTIMGNCVAREHSYSGGPPENDVTGTTLLSNSSSSASLRPQPPSGTPTATLGGMSPATEPMKLLDAATLVESAINYVDITPSYSSTTSKKMSVHIPKAANIRRTTSVASSSTAQVDTRLGNGVVLGAEDVEKDRREKENASEPYGSGSRMALLHPNEIKKREDELITMRNVERRKVEELSNILKDVVSKYNTLGEKYEGSLRSHRASVRVHELTSASLHALRLKMEEMEMNRNNSTRNQQSTVLPSLKPQSNLKLKKEKLAQIEEAIRKKLAAEFDEETSKMSTLHRNKLIKTDAALEQERQKVSDLLAFVTNFIQSCRQNSLFESGDEGRGDVYVESHDKDEDTFSSSSDGDNNDNNNSHSSKQKKDNYVDSRARDILRKGKQYVNCDQACMALLSVTKAIAHNKSRKQHMHNIELLKKDSMFVEERRASDLAHAKSLTKVKSWMKSRLQNEKRKEGALIGDLLATITPPQPSHELGVDHRSASPSDQNTPATSSPAGLIPYGIPKEIADHRQSSDANDNIEEEISLKKEFEGLLREAESTSIGGQYKQLETSIDNLFRMVTHELKRSPFSSTSACRLFEPEHSAQAQLQIMNDFEEWLGQRLQPSEASSSSTTAPLLELASVHARSFLQATREQTTLDLTFGECPREALQNFSTTLLTFLRQSVEPLANLILTNTEGRSSSSQTAASGINSATLIMSTLHRLLSAGGAVSSECNNWLDTCEQRVDARKAQIVTRKGYALRQMLSLLRHIRMDPCSSRGGKHCGGTDPLHQHLSLQSQRHRSEQLLAVRTAPPSTKLPVSAATPIQQLRPLTPPSILPSSTMDIDQRDTDLFALSPGVRQRTNARLGALPRVAFKKLPPLHNVDNL